MVTWKDITSYSRGDKEQRPTTWRCFAGEVQVTIVRDHIHYPGVWLLMAVPFYRQLVLTGILTEDVSGAQQVALEEIRRALQEALAALA